MGTKYSSTLPTGYNAAPPADDGSAVASNQVKWSTVTSKIGAPLVNWATALDTKLQTAFDLSMTTTAVDKTTDATNHLKPITVTGAAIISLGNAATMGTGYQTAVVNMYSAAITVKLATGTDKLNTVVNGSFSLPPGTASVPASVEMKFINTPLR